MSGTLVTPGVDVEDSESSDCFFLGDDEECIVVDSDVDQSRAPPHRSGSPSTTSDSFLNDIDSSLDLSNVDAEIKECLFAQNHQRKRLKRKRSNRLDKRLDHSRPFKTGLSDRCVKKVNRTTPLMAIDSVAVAKSVQKKLRRRKSRRQHLDRQRYLINGAYFNLLGCCFYEKSQLLALNDFSRHCWTQSNISKQDRLEHVRKVVLALPASDFIVLKQTVCKNCFCTYHQITVPPLYSFLVRCW